MSYNTVETASRIVGEEVRPELLEAARSIIDQHSAYRWQETTLTEVFSGKARKRSIMLKRPIVEVLEFTVDSGSGPVAQAAGTDYELRKSRGEVFVHAGLPEGYDNVSIRYKYGFTSEHQSFKAVLLAEAQIAFYLQKNPAMLSQMQLGGQSGLTISYPEGISLYLALVPRPAGFFSPA